MWKSSVFLPRHVWYFKPKRDSHCMTLKTHVLWNIVDLGFSSSIFLNCDLIDSSSTLRSCGVFEKTNLKMVFKRLKSKQLHLGSGVVLWFPSPSPSQRAPQSTCRPRWAGRTIRSCSWITPKISYQNTNDLRAFRLKCLLKWLNRK